jgi:hypothetical protein
MKTATAVDVREWIYDLTKDEKIGPQSNSKKNDKAGAETKTSSQSYGKANGNFNRILTEDVHVALDPSSTMTLPAGTGVTVYRKLIRADRGGWVALPDAMLAVFFIKDGVRTIEQITVRTGGRVVRRKF